MLISKGSGDEMITSAGNAKIKRIIQLNEKAKLRRQEDAFVVEGIKMFLEAPEEGIQEIYISESFLQNGDEESNEKIKKLQFKKEVTYEVVSDQIFQRISATVSPQGILCIIKQYHHKLEELLKKDNPLLVVVENLQDPGNLGTLFRSGEGAGIDGVIISSNSVDIYNPKTIRSTMGSIYRVPFVITDELSETITLLKNRKIQIFAAHLDGMDIYDGVSFCEGSAFLIGNEGNGLSEKITLLATKKIRIPMEGKVESLNAATAATLLMYEARRQRKN